MRAAGLAASLAAALSGCAGLAERPQPVDTLAAIAVPADWSTPGALARATPDAAAAQAWWWRFNDPLLARLVEQALQANGRVVTAQAALRQARALRDVAEAGLGPGVNAAATAQRSQSGSGDGSTRFAASLDASWELDLFGSQRSALQASQATTRGSAASLGDVQVSIAAETGLAYITLRNIQARLAVAQANLASQRETLQITGWRLQAGLVSQLEAEQARAATAQTEALLPALQTSLAQTRHALAVLTGQAPAALDTVLADTAPVPLPPTDLAWRLPAETLRQRPDVRAAEWQVSAAAARVAQADAARLPSFRLGGSLGLSALTLGALGNGASLLGSLLAGVSLPVFDGGAARAQVQAQQAALDQARAGYQDTVLAALQQVEDALVALRGDRQRQQRLQQAADAAGQAALLARQRYGSGLVDFQTVLDTQRTLLSTQDNLASAGADVSAGHVRLFKALGGGWQPDETDDLARRAPSPLAAPPLAGAPARPNPTP